MKKSLFRRGQCQMAMSNHDEAIEDFQGVLKLNPSNVAATQHIQLCREQIKIHQAKEKQLYAKIFAKMAKENEKTENKANGEAKTDEQTSGEPSTNST